MPETWTVVQQALGKLSNSRRGLVQLDPWANRARNKVDACPPPKKLDEEVARLHLDRIGVPPEGPYKPEHYRY